MWKLESVVSGVAIDNVIPFVGKGVEMDNFFSFI